MGILRMVQYVNERVNESVNVNANGNGNVNGSATFRCGLAMGRSCEAECAGIGGHGAAEAMARLWLTRNTPGSNPSV